ncbi:MAG: hypothetical protein R3E79_05685 [Caldilineaceae bacterium]
MMNYHLMVAVAEAVHEDRLQQAAQQRRFKAIQANRIVPVVASRQQIRNLFHVLWQKIQVATAADNPVLP